MPPTLSIKQNLEAAALSYQSGQLEHSKALLKEILHRQHNQPDALQLLGFIAHRQGQSQDAIAYLQQAVSQRPEDPELQNNLGNLHKSAGNYDEARRCYESALKTSPQNFAAYYNLGNTWLAMNNHSEAASAYRTAISINGNFADAHYNLAIALKAQGDLSEAVAAYRRTIELQPAYGDAYVNLGSALLEAHEQGQDVKLDEALEAFQQVKLMRPQSAEIENNLGVVYTRQGNYQQAKQCLLQALQLDHNFLEAKNNLGVVQRLLGESREALQTFSDVLRQDPLYAACHRNLGNTLAEIGQHQAALQAYEKALQIDPLSFETIMDCGLSHASLGNTETACRYFEQAAKLKPESLLPVWAQGMSSLPNFYMHPEEIEQARAKYSGWLQEVSRNCRLESPSQIKDAAEAVGLLQPFNLNLQCLNNCSLQKTYGQLIQAIMQAAYPQWSQPLPMPPKSADGRLRIGIVSRHFNNHSDWKILISGWLHNLSRRHFEFFGYSTGGKQDQVNQQARSLFEHYRQPADLETLGKQIRQDNLHALLFPEIGQCPLTLRLAALRLAPLQLASWGVPQTSGLPTIDYFLSSDLMEPVDAQTHYSEKLLRLPNLSAHYQAANTLADTSKLSAWGVRPDAVRYLCVNSLLKYYPQFDKVFPAIAQQVKNAQFLFIGKPAELKEKMQKRLQAAFADYNLQADDYVTFLPGMTQSEFAGLVKSGHVYLDSLDFSGCNTTLETLEHQVPVVTLPGDFMRGRQSTGILKMIGVTETIASNLDEYIDLSIKLGLDKDFHQQVSQKIAQNRHLLYGDRQCIEFLESFLRERCRS